MKIQLVSDLHQEFSLLELENAGADVLILSGDIVVADYFTRGDASPRKALANDWLAWFERTCAKFPRVYYVLGNHEHYHGRFYETATILQNTLGHIRNLVILDNSFDRYEGYTFVGGTLWTNFDRDNFKAMLVRDGLNDYRLIEGRNYRKLMPVDTTAYHDALMRTINFTCRDWDKLIVVGHHAPSYQSTPEEYKTGRYASLNPGYASHLDPFIEEHTNIVLWTHGHMHSSSDYFIGSTRIVANPRGYAKPGQVPENPNFDPNLVIEC